VPIQIIGTFVIKLQHFYAEKRLKTPFARNDQIRIFVLEGTWYSLLT